MTATIPNRPPIPLTPARRDAAITACAELTGVPVERLRGPSRERSTTYARQVLIAAMYDRTGATLEEIGAATGGRHHTTVMHAIERGGELRKTEPEYQALYDLISEALTRRK